MNRLHRVSVRWNGLHEARKEAKRRGISLAELVRHALGTVLRRKDDDSSYMRCSGIVQSGDPEASRTVDEVVYVRERP